MRTLAQYFDDIQRNAYVVSPSHVHTPMLVVRSVASRDEESLVFQTRFTSRMPMPDETLGSAETPIVSGHVLPVEKRPGGAFPDRIGLGRAPNVDIRLALAQVSKYHAFFHVSTTGEWSVTDAGSRNGTSVNDRLIAPKVSTKLEDGFEVGVGPHRLAFYTPTGFVALLRKRAGVP